MKPLSASPPTETEPGRATFSLLVPKSLCNAGNNLHGGAVALIFDMCTSMAVIVASREGFWDTGHVSRTLNCTYLRPAPEGTELIVEAEVSLVDLKYEEQADACQRLFIWVSSWRN